MQIVDHLDRIDRELLDTLPTVLIVGAGCAGTLVAINLLRDGPPLRIVLVERSGRFGLGVAYSTRDARHRLNVVAERMSAFPDERCHFADWAQRTLGPQEPGAYLPRMRFGEYLRETLAGAERAAPASRLERVTGEVVDLVPGALGVTAALAGGSGIHADYAILALGNLPPASPIPLPTDPRVTLDPWAEGALDDPARTTLLVGSGLTAVDVALSLCDDPRSRVVAVSRSGWLPFEHLPGLRKTVPMPLPPPAPTTVDRLERWLACHVAAMRRQGHDWRDVIDGLRPELDRLWQSLPAAERERFLRERWRAWEVRRHRMPPAVAERVRALQAEHRLRVHAARIVDVRARPSHIEVRLAGPPWTVRADRLVLCTGPGTDVRSAASPLLRALFDRGLASPDPLALGLRATADGSLVAADGRPQPAIRVLGALRRGELWETTALREIRAQAQTIARALAPAPSIQLGATS